MVDTHATAAARHPRFNGRAGWLASVRRWWNGTFPTTHSLDPESWQRRHRVIVVLLWLHVAGLFVFGMVAGRGMVHLLLDCLPVAVAAEIACLSRLDRRARMLASSFGLITASAVLVHLGHGSIEMHFHYFVALAVIGLYEDWLPFLGAIAFVLIEHGLLGALWPGAIYNHAAAIEHPWRWAAIHAAFVAAASLATLGHWRFAEQARVRERAARQAAEASANHAESLVEQLRVTEATYRTLFAANPHPAYVYDTSTLRVLAVNDAAFAQYGYSREAFLSLRVSELHMPNDQARFQSVMAQTPDQLRLSSNWQQRRADGSTLWVDVASHPITFEDRAARLAIATDVTARKRAEAALQTSEALHRSVVDSAMDAIIVLGAGGTIQSFNHAAERIFGYRGADMLGQSVTRLLPERMQATVATSVQHHLSSEATKSAGTTVELVGVRSDGVEVPLEMSMTAGSANGSLFVTGILRDISERKALEAELTHQAFHDHLTGLPNRALFNDRLQHAVLRAVRRDSSLAVLFVDIDNFKRVNDSLGHTAGDELLITVADRLGGCLRAEDTLARLGGDEFTILLEDIDGIDDAVEVARRISEHVTLHVMCDNREISIGVSIGIALSVAGQMDAEELLRDADVAMYAAKRRGKGGHALFTPTMTEAVWERLTLESDLRHALERSELRLQYQPIVDLANGTVGAVEALLRWDHPTRGLIEPVTFIRVAEETGLIIPIGAWVLREACGEVAGWSEFTVDGRPLSLNVNLSGRQFQQLDLAESVASVLAKSGLEPSRLRLEITETALMETGEATLATLQRLKALGVQIAIDDFGTGYSSLSYLKQFPVDVLKIDRSFVDGIDQHPESRSIVRALVAVAMSLNLNVVAEGIETDAQREELIALGCDVGQGFYFSKAVSPAGIAALLRLQRVDGARVAEAAD
ncbi:MAG TPA: EAL domain-containing protein [Thermomicrobiales bacterium]|nr:EAL domain-containing protein [Thermomicrobiales bacterium]